MQKQKRSKCSELIFDKTHKDYSNLIYKNTTISKNFNHFEAKKCLPKNCILSFKLIWTLYFTKLCSICKILVFSIFLTQTCTTYKHANMCTQPCSFFNYWIILRCTEIKIIYLTTQGALSDSFRVQSYHTRCLFFFQISRKIPASHCRGLSPESVRMFFWFPWGVYDFI